MIVLLFLLFPTINCEIVPENGKQPNKVEGPKGSLRIKALGRPMFLGTLYDRRNDKFVHGKTLWSADKLTKGTSVKLQPSTNYELTASQGINERASLLDINAQLKLSFLSGLVEVQGSAGFLMDKKASNKVARVVARYRETTTFKSLNMDHLSSANIQYNQVFGDKLATDVVVGILYGAEANFVFDTETSSEEDARKVAASLEVSVKSIPSVQVAGSGSVIIEEKIKKVVEKFRCKFYGDYSLPTTPTTYIDAIKVYKQLPQLMGKNKEKAVPLYVYLLPLATLKSEAAQILLKISNAAVNKVSRYFDEFDGYIRICNDNAQSKVSAIFPQVKAEFNTLKLRIEEFRTRFQAEISKLLPKIRGGEAAERDLLKIFNRKERSPFNKGNLQKWINLKKNKVAFLQEIIKHLSNNLKFVSSEELDQKMIDPNVDYMIIFVVILFRKEDTYLSSLRNYLKTYNVSDSKIEEPWYKENDTVHITISDQIRTLNNALKYHINNKKVSFHGTMEYMTTKDDPVKGSFFDLIDKTRRSKIQKYLFPVWTKKEQNGRPSSFGNKTHSDISIKWHKPMIGANSVEKYKIYYTREANKNGPLSSWHVEETSKGRTTKNICDLAPNTTYVFIMEAWCIFGICYRSNVSEPITTTPRTGLIPLKHCKWVEEKHWRKEADTCKILEAADLKLIEDRIDQLEVNTGKGNSQGRKKITFLLIISYHHYQFNFKFKNANKIRKYMQF